ncbi:MAG: hypothetical protein JJT94_08710 [Bernardetiaceae bacterium]|nr:hypothetical protein [Bernardetiaceae bacterium]
MIQKTNYLLIILLCSLFFSSSLFAQTDSTRIDEHDTYMEDSRDWAAAEEYDRNQNSNDKYNDGDEMSLRDRIYFGGNLGFGFGTVTFVDISPIAGYRITEGFSLGAGFTYQYWRNNLWGSGPLASRYSVYGGRLFARQFVVENIFVQAEFESLNSIDATSDPSSRGIGRGWFSSFFLGAGYAAPVGQGRTAFTIMALYNLTRNPQRSLYQSPLVIRGGIQF